MLRMASIEKRYCNLPLARVAMDECAVPSGWCGAGVIADATAEAGWLEKVRMFGRGRLFCNLVLQCALMLIPCARAHPPLANHPDPNERCRPPVWGRRPLPRT